MGLLSEKWSLQLLMQLIQLCKRSLKKIQDFNGIWINPWPRDMGAIL